MLFDINIVYGHNIWKQILFLTPSNKLWQFDAFKYNRIKFLNFSGVMWVSKNFQHVTFLHIMTNTQHINCSVAIFFIILNYE